MKEKEVLGRIIHKHDIEANWLKAINFVPKQGEIIIYDIDDNYLYERFKIGDGTTNINKLPFSSIDYFLFSNALTDSIINISAIRLNDVSPLEHNIEVSIKSKNLISSPFGEINVENGKTYTISVKLKDDIELPETYYYSLAWYTTDGTWNNHLLFSDGDGQSSNTKTFIAGYQGNHNYHIDCIGLTEDMFEYTQLEEGSVATEYEPYVPKIEDINFKSYGKNLYSFTKSNFLNYDLPDYLPGLELTISTDRATNDGTIQFIKSNDEFSSYTDVGYLGTATETESITYTVEEGYKYRIMFSEEALAVTNKVQVELGVKATEYEEYKEPIDGINTIRPTTTLISDFVGVKLEATYNKDINRTIGNIDSALDAIITIQNGLIGGEAI